MSLSIGWKVPLSWAPKDMQACYGETAVPLNNSPTLGCAVSCVVDIRDVYMLLSRLGGHSMEISKLQAFLDLWCCCWPSVGHILKLSPQGRPQSLPCLKFSAAQPAWSEVSDGLGLPWKEMREKESANGRQRTV